MESDFPMLRIRREGKEGKYHEASPRSRSKKIKGRPHALERKEMYYKTLEHVVEVIGVQLWLLNFHRLGLFVHIPPPSARH